MHTTVNVDVSHIVDIVASFYLYSIQQADIRTCLYLYIL